MENDVRLNFRKGAKEIMKISRSFEESSPFSYFFFSFFLSYPWYPSTTLCSPIDSRTTRDEQLDFQ